MSVIRDPLIHTEIETNTTGSKLNWLRAAVLGANDGIVSISSVIVGVAGASSSTSFVLTAGIAAVVAGALSMAVGEYISVSTQRDSEKALLDKERQSLETIPETELRELAIIYEKKGLTKETAKKVAAELTAHDVFAAHIHAEYGLNPDELTNPWHAAYASGLAFLCGAVIPMFAVIIPPKDFRIPAVFVSVVVALMITGALSAHAGGADKKRAMFRVVFGGVLAMLITYGIGKLFGVVGI
ncbi:MAG: VIT family protein [Candidatus Roizmanbacteria bacterium]